MKKWKGLVCSMVLCLMAAMVLPGVSRASVLQMPTRSVGELLTGITDPVLSVSGKMSLRRTLRMSLNLRKHRSLHL